MSTNDIQIIPRSNLLFEGYRLSCSFLQSSVKTVFDLPICGIIRRPGHVFKDVDGHIHSKPNSQELPDFKCQCKLLISEHNETVEQVPKMTKRDWVLNRLYGFAFILSVLQYFSPVSPKHTYCVYICNVYMQYSACHFIHIYISTV